MHVLLLNILLTFFLLITAELILYNHSNDMFKNNICLGGDDKIIKCKIDYDIIMKRFDYEKYKEQFRPVEKPINCHSQAKKSIILFGCSYVWGTGLNDNQMLSYKISSLTSRTVFNRAMYGWGVQHMLYQLKREDFYKEVQEPEYVFYVFIDDHMNRLFRRQEFAFKSQEYLHYSLKNNKFIEDEPLYEIFGGLYLIKYLDLWITANSFQSENFENNFNYMELMFRECIRLLKQHYNKAKFIILLYPSPYAGVSSIEKGNWKKIESYGFQVINLEELVGHSLADKQYKVKDNEHPSEKAWDEISTALVKRLKM